MEQEGKMVKQSKTGNEEGNTDRNSQNSGSFEGLYENIKHKHIGS